MKFESWGLRFDYPDNWSLDEQEALAGNRSVTVYSPSGGAFWSISVHPRSADPVSMTKAATEAMKEEYDSLEAEWVEEQMANHQIVGYDLSFYCLDLTSSAVVRGIKTPHATYLVFWQAEDRDFARLADVFRAMTVSLLRHLKPTRPARSGEA
jgi:hypothetical protein